MNCAIIKDLLPLYADGCCSDETAEAVRQHLADCPDCKAVYDTMREPVPTVKKPEGKIVLQKVYERRASVLQAVLFMMSFFLMAVGVAMEAGTPISDLRNGIWAFLLVVPQTGFLLSLANYFFIREYRSAKHFRIGSVLLTLLLIIAALLWTLWHYDMLRFPELAEIAVAAVVFPSKLAGRLSLLFLLHTAALAFLSWFSAKRYARWMGKL